MQSAHGLAEDLRALIEATIMLERCSITVSIGAAPMRESETPAMWLEHADRMLYLAKQSGRNTVCIAD